MLDFVREIQNEYYEIHKALFGESDAMKYLKDSNKRYGVISRLCQENNLKTREEWQEWNSANVKTVRERYEKEGIEF